MSDFQYPVLVRTSDDHSGCGSWLVLVELADGDRFTFKTMAAAEAFMTIHALKPITGEEMGMLRAVMDDAGDGEPTD